MALSELFEAVEARGSQRLFERWRPSTWDEVVGQHKAIERIAQIGRTCGLAGKAYWIRGKSGTGKTTIARLLAREVADPHNVLELDANKLGATDIDRMEEKMRLSALGEKPGRVYIINEADGLRKDIRDRLKTLLEEDLPRHVMLIFTTTLEGEQSSLWEDAKSSDEASQLLSRCEEITLSQRGLAKAFARRAKQIARAEGLNGAEMKDYVRLVRDNRNNMRRVLEAIQAGEMLKGD